MPPNANAERDVYITYANGESGAIRPVFCDVRVQDDGACGHSNRSRTVPIFTRNCGSTASSAIMGVRVSWQ
jgi:hypothetical protein